MKILVFPWDVNPYQKQLYGALRRQYPDTRVAYALRLPYVWWMVLPLWLAAARLGGYRIIHLHWHKLALESGPQRLRYALNKRLYPFFISLMKRLGYTIIWTVHNVLPHEPQTADDRALSQYLAQAVDGKIIHSTFTIKQMKDAGMDTTRTSVIPHGNYDGIYPDTVTRAQARKVLGIAKGDYVILFFGKIRGYKGVGSLLEAYGALSRPGVRLVIAGQCDDPETDNAIRRAQTTAAIDYYPGHVSNADVSTYFKACDIVCLPFQSVTTSGSLLLTLTFGKPLVAPRTGAVCDIPSGVGYLYNPMQPDGLRLALTAALGHPADAPAQGHAARTYAQTLSWDAIAVQTYILYRQMLAHKQRRSNTK